MTKRIAIIPARGGSKRIPNKNVRNFCGKPIIGYILETARDSGLFDVIHVSTDSEDIARIVEHLGFTVDFMRPSELSDDVTPIMPVLKYVLNTYSVFGQDFDEVFSLMACSPLVNVNDLQSASLLFNNCGNRYSVLGVAEYSAPIEWAFTRSSDGHLSPVNSGMFAIRSQDLEKKYFDAGVFAIFTSEKIRSSEGAGSDDEFVGYVISKDKAIDIDDESDWTFAEAMYLIKNRK